MGHPHRAAMAAGSDSVSRDQWAAAGLGRIYPSMSSMVTSFDEYLRYIDEVPPDDEIRVTVDCCLAEAGEAFGALETGWDYQVELRESPAHPETVVVGPGKVRIYLTAGRSRVGYLFEAGHEAVHCLNPSNYGETFLEEAVAVAFSLRVDREAVRSSWLGPLQTNREIRAGRPIGSHHRRRCRKARSTAARTGWQLEEGGAGSRPGAVPARA